MVFLSSYKSNPKVWVYRENLNINTNLFQWSCIYIGTLSLNVHNISKMSNLRQDIYKRFTDSNFTRTLFHRYFSTQHFYIFIKRIISNCPPFVEPLFYHNGMIWLFTFQFKYTFRVIPSYINYSWLPVGTGSSGRRVIFSIRSVCPISMYWPKVPINW